MVTNSDFRLCKEERKNKSFFKVLTGADISSENLRAIPYDFMTSLSEHELSDKMKITAVWGSSWEMRISKNPRFYFIEKSGWNKFVRDNFLGYDEYLAFTHKGHMCFTVNIFKPDGSEMIHPQQSMAFLASSSRVKREHDEVVSPDLGPTTAETNGGRKNKRKLVSPDPAPTTAGTSGGGKNKRKLVSPDLAPTTAGTSGGGKNKRKLDSAKGSKISTMNKTTFTPRRDSAGASSSSAAEFTMLMQKSYLLFFMIRVSVAKGLMPKVRTTFKIHHQDMKRSWDVVYIPKSVGACFSSGWKCLTKEYPVAVGDTCKFTFLKPTELLLVVSKPGEETH